MSPSRRQVADSASALDPLAIALSGTTLIEASAGTGKTHTITTLYARLLLEAGLGVDQILVVTYTIAATAELRARVRRRLHELLLAYEGAALEDETLARFVEARRAGGHTDADRGRLLAALHGFDQAAIFTIHGFCQRVLQEHAFESGAPFEVDFLTDQRPLVDEIVRDYWVRELHQAPRDFVAYALGKRPLETLSRLAGLVNTHSEMEVIAAQADPDDVHLARWQQLQIGCAEYVRRELRRRKDEARQQSFDDLLQRLAEGLRGDSGETLAARIRKRLPAALIDEFQDTDPLQYEIFRRVYHAAEGTALFLIGDPKQAIYAFRGADVFAYLTAKRDAGPVHTLLTNWRSDPSLVRAVNTLFGREAAFVFDDIPFRNAHATDSATDQLGGSAAGSSPFEILFVRRWGQEGSQGKLTRKFADIEFTDLVASEIVRFVRSGATIGARPVAFADIAVLCRKNSQVNAIQSALRRLGVPSVLQSEQSVFETSEAMEVARLIRAMAEPSDSTAVRAALATTLLGQNASDLFDLQTNERRWDDWLQDFQDWNQTWLKRGFVAAFRRMLETQAVMPRLLEMVDGERRLTNILHLMELLHSASIEERFGPSALAHWLEQMRRDDKAREAYVGEAAQIRLESDDAAVKLVTIHKSKGLQYPIVYCPYLWEGGALHRNDQAMPRFHDPADGNRLKLDLGSERLAAHRQIAEREGLAENLRLLYVALTRAQHRCSIVWGAFTDAASAAVGYLLHRDPDAPEASDSAARIKQFLRKGGDADMRADLERLAAASDGAIAVNDLSPERVGRVSAQEGAPQELNGRIAQRRIGSSWRMASFSSLIRTSTALSLPAEEGIDHDTGADAAPGTLAAIEDTIALHDFPAGTRTGQMLHDIFEHLDFPAATPEVLQRAVATALAQTDVAAQWTERLAGAIAAVLDTPLDGGRLSLRQLARRQRLNELEFVFPVALGERQAATADTQLGLWSATSRAAPFTAKRLATVFAKHAAPSLRAYSNRLAQLDFAALSGFLKGFIDLVFEYEGRWYVVDYKSNLLGPTPTAYSASRLLPEMAAHHYILQYHLYVVALHRYLTNRLPSYDYERHFGGVYYLFLRGMAPHHPRGNGVFADRPSKRLIEQLSEALTG